MRVNACVCAPLHFKTCGSLTYSHLHVFFIYFRAPDVQQPLLDPPVLLLHAPPRMPCSNIAINDMYPYEETPGGQYKFNPPS